MDIRTLLQEVALREPHAKEVTLQTHDYDKYGRTIADVMLPDETRVNHTPGHAGLMPFRRE